MTTLDVLMAVVIIMGIINITFFIIVLGKLSNISKTVKKNSTMLTENKSNMSKVVKLLDILMKRTKGSVPINLN
jgi:hypothetical protein